MLTVMNTTQQAELQHIRGLEIIREALRIRGASELELRRCDATIAAARARLRPAAAA
jgi:hypothetical protein